MVDLVYFLLLVETHSYYKGLNLGRVSVGLVIFLSSVAAYLFTVFFIVKFITGSSYGMIKAVALISVFLYPLTGLVMKVLSYKSTTLVLVVYTISEFVKFTFMFMMDEMMAELIEAIKGESQEEKFRALSRISQAAVVAIVFAVVGPIITYLFSNWNIMMMSPYNYVIAFSVLSFFFLVSFGLFMFADYFFASSRSEEGQEISMDGEEDEN